MAPSLPQREQDVSHKTLKEGLTKNPAYDALQGEDLTGKLAAEVRAENVHWVPGDAEDLVATHGVSRQVAALQDLA